MARAQKLSPSALAEELTALDGWTVENNKLHREFKFGNFSAAFGFMTRVALEAEKLDHHPEWCNVYSQVTIDLVTHEAEDQITNLDIELARKIDAIAR